MSLIIAFAAGAFTMWCIARVADARRNARKMADPPPQIESEVQSLTGCYWHCESNGFPWVGSTCTYICPGSGGGGLYQ